MGEQQAGNRGGDNRWTGEGWPVFRVGSYYLARYSHDPLRLTRVVLLCESEDGELFWLSVSRWLSDRQAGRIVPAA